MIMRNVTKRFKSVTALSGVSFESRNGINILLGPNGAGKSTLLKCIAGLYHIDHGSVRVLGKDPYYSNEIRYKLGMLSDNYALYDYLSVRENLLFFGRLFRLTRTATLERARRVLKRLNALKFIDSKVYALSRGTKQKVAFCRTVLNDPDVLLLDEPTAFLDASSSAQIRDFMEEYKAHGKTVIFVTQKLDEVMRFDARLSILKGGRLVSDTKTYSLYNSVLRNFQVNIRFSKPVPALRLKKLGITLVNPSAEMVNYVTVRIRHYKDVNRILRKFISSGIYILSVDYLEPLLTSLSD